MGGGQHKFNNFSLIEPPGGHPNSSVNSDSSN